MRLAEVNDVEKQQLQVQIQQLQTMATWLNWDLTRTEASHHGSEGTDDSDGAGGRAPAGGSSRAGRSGVQGSFAHPCQQHLRLV